MSIRLGQAFLMPSGTAHNPSERHMFVVCTGFDANGDVVLASISSWKNDLCDSTCRLDAGCHPFIKRDSYVLYRKSRIEPVAAIEKGLAESILTPLDDVDSQTLDRIIAGLSASKHTHWQVKRHIKRQSQSTNTD